MTTAPARPMGSILAEITDGRGKHAKLGRKLRTCRDTNWLLALVLNTYAKVADGAPLNDLDVMIVEAFETYGLHADLTEHGRLYAGMSTEVRKELFQAPSHDCPTTPTTRSPTWSATCRSSRRRSWRCPTPRHRRRRRSPGPGPPGRPASPGAGGQPRVRRRADPGRRA